MFVITYNKSKEAYDKAVKEAKAAGMTDEELKEMKFDYVLKGKWVYGGSEEAVNAFLK